MICAPHPRLICLLLIGFIASSHGQKFRAGSCTPLSSFITPAFTLSNFQNTWRETARTPTPYRHGWRCVTYNVLPAVVNVEYSFSLSGVKKGGSYGRASGRFEIVNGNGGTTAAGTYFKTTVNYGSKAVTFKYYIVRAQTNYLALYSCENFLFGKIESAIFLTLPGISEASIRAALNDYAMVGIGRSDLEYTYGIDCL